MRLCLFVCLWFNQAKTAEPIQMKLCKKVAYIPGSDIGLFLFRYLSISRWREALLVTTVQLEL